MPLHFFFFYRVEDGPSGSGVTKKILLDQVFSLHFNDKNLIIFSLIIKMLCFEKENSLAAEDKFD